MGPPQQCDRHQFIHTDAPPSLTVALSRDLTKDPSPYMPKVTDMVPICLHRKRVSSPDKSPQIVKPCSVLMAISQNATGTLAPRLSCQR